MRRLPLALLLIALALLPGAAPMLPWQFYALDGERLVRVSRPAAALVAPTAEGRPPTPPDWEVTGAALADVTGDGAAEWVLLLWRPWRDWPIQRWSSLPSPIAGAHDAAGMSCHLALLDPADGREIWVGSALPAPLSALAVGDVDGDGTDEVVTLEGRYPAGRTAPATHVDVWAWNGFGFTLRARSPVGTWRQLALAQNPVLGREDIAVR
jgi:hypothetical protein